MSRNTIEARHRVVLKKAGSRCNRWVENWVKRLAGEGKVKLKTRRIKVVNVDVVLMLSRVDENCAAVQILCWNLCGLTNYKAFTLRTPVNSIRSTFTREPQAMCKRAKREYNTPRFSR